MFKISNTWKKRFFKEDSNDSRSFPMFLGISAARDGWGWGLSHPLPPGQAYLVFGHRRWGVAYRATSPSQAPPGEGGPPLAPNGGEQV